MKIMNENTRKGIMRKYKIMEYVLSVEKFRYSDFVKNLEAFGSKSTLNRELQELVGMKWIEHNIKTKEYSHNPYIKTLDKDLNMQIRDGEKKEIDHDKLVEISSFKEVELRNRITNLEVSQISKDFGDLTNEIFMSDKDNLFLTNIFYSFLREGIIFNPGLWQKLIKPGHFNFKFMIKCNWEKDSEIFNLINDLKDIYKKIGYIPHNINSPFHREKEIKLNNENDEEYYMKAVYKETKRKLTEKKLEDMSKTFQNEFVPLLNNFKSISEGIEIMEPLEQKDLNSIFNHLLSNDKFKNPTIEERKEVSEKYLNSLKQLKNKIFSILEIED